MKKHRDSRRRFSRSFTPNHIVNANNGMWRALWQPKKPGAGSGVLTCNIETDNHPRAGMTVIGLIVPDKERLPLFPVAKELTKACHACTVG
jgi:hypothetical protein